MEENFNLLVGAGEEIGLFIVQEGKDEEYIIDIKGLKKLKKEIKDIKRKNNETFEFTNKCGNILTVSLV